MFKTFPRTLNYKIAKNLRKSELRLKAIPKTASEALLAVKNF